MAGATDVILAIQTNLDNGGGNDALSFAVSQNTFQWDFAFVPPAALTLTAIAFFVTKTGTPVAYNFQVQSDNGSGLPSGTLAWTGASGTIPANQASGWTSELALTTSGTLTMGTLYHVVVSPASDPASANYLSFSYSSIWDISFAPVAGYAQNFAGTSWSTDNCPATIVLVDGNAGVKYGNVEQSATSVVATNTLWVGGKFTAPASMSVVRCGVDFSVGGSSAGAINARLIDNSNTILGTASIPGAFLGKMTGRGLHSEFFFPSAVALTKGSVYRLVWQDAGGSGHMHVEMMNASANSNLYAGLLPGQGRVIATQGTSADGSASPTTWTDTSNQQPMSFSLWAADGPSGGGGGGGGGSIIGSNLIVPVASGRAA